MKLSQKSLTYKVLQNILKNKLIEPKDTVIVAVSGGADSVCLFEVLHLLKEKLNIQLKICHYNHRLRGQASDADEKFVKNLAKNHGVEWICGQAPTKNLFKNEDSARKARYDFFEKILKKEGRGAKISLAHNANDLAETILLRLVRGTGLLGLKSIPLQRKNFVRPLLAFSRKEILDFLKQENIECQTDKSNSDVTVPRNFIRHKVIPDLSKINPNLIETMAKSANIIEDDYGYIELEAQKAFLDIKTSETKNVIVLDRKGWLRLHPSIQRMVLRLSIDQIDDLSFITQTQIDEVCQVILQGEGKKYKSLPRSLRISLRSGKIIVSKSKPH